MFKYLIAMLFLVGCATEVPETLKGAAGSAVVIKTVEKVKEVFTPHFPLLAKPSEICDITTDPVTCYVIPCVDDKDCVLKWDRNEWFKNNPKVFTLESNVVVEIVKFCDKNPDACLRYKGFYSGKKIVLMEEKWKK